MNPLVSVLIPTYNRGDVVCESLDSVLRQDYRPIEVIVVDDGSTDDTSEQVAAWTRNHMATGLSLLYLRQQNSGPGAARNAAFQHSRGELIQYLDSDDRLHPDRFKAVVPLFDRESMDIVQTGFEGFCSDCGQVFETHYGNPAVDQFSLALRGRLWPNSLRATFRRRVVEASGGWNVAMTCFEDYDFVVRALGCCREAVAVRDVLAHARRGGSGPRVTDRLRTREGRAWRIHCEQSLADVVSKRSDVPIGELQAFASRLYALGLRSNASGWPDLGRKCKEIATGVNVPLDLRGRRRRLVCQLGRYAGLAYERLAQGKARFRNRRADVVLSHVCSKQLE